MSMAESEGLGVQLLWTSLARKRHCSAYPIRKEYSLGRMGTSLSITITRPTRPGAELEWRLVSPYPYAGYFGDLNILRRKPRKTLTVRKVKADSLLTMALCPGLRIVSNPGESIDPSQTVHKRDKDTVTASYCVCVASSMSDLGWQCMDRQPLG